MKYCWYIAPPAGIPLPIYLEWSSTQLSWVAQGWNGWWANRGISHPPTSCVAAHHYFWLPFESAPCASKIQPCWYSGRFWNFYLDQQHIKLLGCLQYREEGWWTFTYNSSSSINLELFLVENMYQKLFKPSYHATLNLSMGWHLKPVWDFETPHMSFVNLVWPQASAPLSSLQSLLKYCFCHRHFSAEGVILVIRGFKPILFFGRNFKKPAG